MITSDSTKKSYIAKNSISIKNLSAFLKQCGLDIGQNKLFKKLREDGFLIKNEELGNVPTRKAMDMGLFETKEITIRRSVGKTARITTFVTATGQVYFINKYLKEYMKNENSTNWK